MAILAGFKRGIKEVYTQWAYILVRGAWTLVIALIFYKIWSPVVQNPETTLAYIAIAEAFYFTSRGNVAWRLEKEYNAGYLDVRLLRPIPIWLQYITESIGPGISGYIMALVFLGTVLYACAGITINPLTALVAYFLYIVAKHFLYFTLGAFVVDLGRTTVLRMAIMGFDLITIIVPAEIIGNAVYMILPNAYVYYWPGQFAVTGTLPSFWWIGVGLMFLATLLAEKHIRHKIEVFGG